MLNKEQMFILNEFVNRYATKDVWYVSDELLKMATELIEADKAKVEIIDEEVGMIETI